MSVSKRSADILLVEDNPGDARLTKEALRDGGIIHTLHHVTDGQEAIDFLHRRNGYASAPRPDFVLLDLNLPRRNGHEVLMEIKNSESLLSIPVCILTTSDSLSDIRETYKHHANCYLTKPVELEHFMAAMKELETFWLSTVALPPGDL